MVLRSSGKRCDKAWLSYEPTYMYAPIIVMVCFMLWSLRGRRSPSSAIWKVGQAQSRNLGRHRTTLLLLYHDHDHDHEHFTSSPGKFCFTWIFITPETSRVSSYLMAPHYTHTMPSVPVRSPPRSIHNPHTNRLQSTELIHTDIGGIIHIVMDRINTLASRASIWIRCRTS